MLYTQSIALMLTSAMMCSLQCPVEFLELLQTDLQYRKNFEDYFEMALFVSCLTMNPALVV